MNTYSFTLGLKKSLTQVAIFALGLGTIYIYQSYPNLADTPIVDLVSEFLGKFLGGLTVGGVITLGVNWLKNRNG